MCRKFYRCEDCGMLFPESDLKDCVELHTIGTGFGSVYEEHYSGCPNCESTNLEDHSVMCGTCSHYESAEEMCPIHGEVDAVFDGHDCDDWEFREEE